MLQRSLTRTIRSDYYHGEANKLCSTCADTNCRQARTRVGFSCFLFSVCAFVFLLLASLNLVFSWHVHAAFGFLWQNHSIQRMSQEPRLPLYISSAQSLPWMAICIRRACQPEQQSATAGLNQTKPDRYLSAKL